MWIRDSLNSERFQRLGTEMALPERLSKSIISIRTTVQYRRMGLRVGNTRPNV